MQWSSPENTVTHGQSIQKGEPCQGNTHRWVLALGTPRGATSVLTLLRMPLLSPPTMHHVPLWPLPSTPVNAQMEQTSENETDSAWGIRGFGRIQSNLPSISSLAFDYVDDEDCKQNSLSLLINSLWRTLKIFNYTVWKAAVTRSGRWAWALLSAHLNEISSCFPCFTHLGWACSKSCQLNAWQKCSDVRYKECHLQLNVWKKILRPANKEGFCLLNALYAIEWKCYFHQ